MRAPRDSQNDSTPRVHCAVYTRTSTEEGLESEFNSLDAQRESGESFIASQRQEGWVVRPTGYDDAGYSGGTLERPALQRLLADVEAGAGRLHRLSTRSIGLSGLCWTSPSSSRSSTGTTSLSSR